MIADAVSRLSAAGVPSPQVDAVLLAEHATGLPGWRLRLGCQVEAAMIERFDALVSARAGRIPTQHLTGAAYFRHLTLAVGPGVFLPRPETELLVDRVHEHVRGGTGPPIVVDMCTGSGAIAIAVATEVPGARVVGMEIDPGALRWAQANAAGYRREISASGSSLAFVGGDATKSARANGGLWHLRGQVDVVLTNPPYVPESAIPRDPEVRDHDPALALYGGPDGLDVVHALIAQASLLLRGGGLLLIEHADSQGDAAGGLGVPGVLRREPATWREVEDHMDLAERPRHTSARRMPG